ncbi:MAG: SDR family NAD(P)-dependent oxidoreductase [Deltaproteobacteria bacterium]|nr:SDR family NAD(P)-dependent oxidoreductase [Nannocystaceae bacterium]
MSERNAGNAGAELAGCRCVVTGASGGIGEAVARTLVERGAQSVVLVARAGEKLETARTRLSARYPSRTVTAMACELSLRAEVRELAAALAATRVDVLVLNAAMMPAERVLTNEGIELTLATNHLAPYLLGRLLLTHLPRGGRIVVVGADPGMLAREPVDLDDLAYERGFSPARAYMRTKNMNAMFAYALARRAAPLGITVNAAHPGIIRTSLGRRTTGLLGFALAVAKPLLPSAERGADTPAWLAWSPDVAERTGLFFVSRRERVTAPHTRDPARQETLWQRSAALVDLEP